MSKTQQQLEPLIAALTPEADSTITGDIFWITLSEYLCLVDYHDQSMPTWFALHPSWYLSHPTSNLRFHLGFAFASHWILWVYTFPANIPFLNWPIKLTYSGPIVNTCQPPAIPVTHAGVGPRKAELCFGLAASVAHIFRPLLVALSNPFLVQRASVTGEGVKRWCWPIANPLETSRGNEESTNKVDHVLGKLWIFMDFPYIVNYFSLPLCSFCFSMKTKSSILCETWVLPPKRWGHLFQSLAHHP